MRNPFEKNDHKIHIAGIPIGAAAAAFYFFATNFPVSLTVCSARNRSRKHITTQAYLHHKDKLPKTDREKLRKYEFLHPQAAANDTAHHSEQRT
jgi:hypothetical protein